MKNIALSIVMLFAVHSAYCQTLIIKSGNNRAEASLQNGATVESSFFQSDSMILTYNDGRAGKDSVITYTLIVLKDEDAKAYFITAEEDITIPGMKKMNLEKSKMIITIRRKHTPDKRFIVEVR